MAKQVQSNAFAEYLDRVEGSLRMPPTAAAAIRDELLAHLVDSRDALIAEGMSHEAAEREALSRLGRPDALGEEMRRTHQSTRRLLAAAGGGAFAAGGFAILGMMLGTAALLLSYIALAVSLTTLFGPEAGPITLFFDRGWNSFISAIAAWVAAWLATRHALVAFAERSRRRVADLRVLAALLATACALTVAMTWSVEQNWASVVAIAALPAVAAAAALSARDRQLNERQRRLTAVRAAAVLVPLSISFLVAAMYLPGSFTALDGEQPQVSPEEHWHQTGWAAVGRDLPWNSPPDPDYVLAESGQLVSASVPMDDTTWSDWRLEMWAGAGEWDSLAVSQALSIAPLTRGTEHLTASQRADVYPGVVQVWAALTAEDARGERYVVKRQGIQTAFRGTIVDWVTAVVSRR